MLLGNVTMNGNNSTGNTRSMAEMNRTWFLRVSSAVFYAVASFMIMVINKRILTVYKFPSFQVTILAHLLHLQNITLLLKSITSY